LVNATSAFLKMSTIFRNSGSEYTDSLRVISVSPVNAIVKRFASSPAASATTHKNAAKSDHNRFIGPSPRTYATIRDLRAVHHTAEST